MGISAQQHRTSSGLFNATRSSLKTRSHNNILNNCWAYFISKCVSPAAAALHLFAHIILIIAGLLEVLEWSCYEHGYSSPSTSNQTMSFCITILYDGCMLINISNRLHIRSPVINVAFICSFFTLFFLNLTLVLISNPSLANPGPINNLSVNNLSVYFQNVQGFVDPGKGLTNPTPVLNLKKITEFQAHTYKNKPDII